jgi:hypothetical protein
VRDADLAITIEIDVERRQVPVVVAGNAGGITNFLQFFVLWAGENDFLGVAA